MGLLTGKTAIVTGAARGIGKGIALKFAAEGANIAFTDLVIDENGQATEAEITALKVRMLALETLHAADMQYMQDINAEMVLRVMRGLVLALIDMGEYRVPLSYLVLNRDFIYVDSNYEVEFICIPV